MELFVLDDEVARCEAALPSLRDDARLAMLVRLSWHLRQRETARAIALCVEAEALLSHIALPDNERLRMRARLLLIRGEECWLFFKLGDAEAAARAALEVFGTLGYAIGCADAHWLLAFVANERGDQSCSVAALKSAAKACSTCGDDLRSAAVLVALSYLGAFADRPGAGPLQGGRVDILAPPDSHQGLVALANSFQIRLYFKTGDYAGAILCGKLALGGALASGQIKFAIIATMHIGAALFKLNNVEAAQVWMQSALELARVTGWPMIIGGCMTGIADLTYLLGQPAPVLARAATAGQTVEHRAAGRKRQRGRRDPRQAPQAEREEKHGAELARLLASASHDLRQPMHALNLYLGALSNVSLPEPAVTLLTNVRKCAGVMDGMFLNLLDLSRLDAQYVRPHVERFPVASLLTGIVLEFSPRASAKGLDLRMVPCSASLLCDPALVEQILRVFVANAIRYTASGKVLIGCRRKGARLRISVYDTGIGMSPHQQEALFAGLGQVDSTRRDSSQGLGLGMAIVQRLARLLSTPVVLVSALGHGSMFAIDVPVSSFNPIVATPNDMLSTISIEILNAKLVVVVDDDEVIREATRILIEQWGCVVVTAMSGADAVLKLGMSPRVPDALICDYRLVPNENGLDVIRDLHNEFNHEIPALLVTGDTIRESLCGVAQDSLLVLHKPVHANVLRDALIRLLSR